MKMFWTYMISSNPAHTYMRSFVLLLLTAALTACQQEDDMSTTDPIPEGKGRVTMTIKARRPAPATRAETGNWLDPVDSKERIHDYKVVFVNSSNEVVEMVSNTVDAQDGVEQDEFRFHLAPGNYTVYGFANLSAEQWAATGITEPVKSANGEVTAVGNFPANFAQRTINTTNGWNTNIPMTSRTDGQQITVVAGENQNFAVEVVRTMAKMQFDLTNKSGQKIEILGYEIYPLTTTNVLLTEPATLDNIHYTDTTSYQVTLADPLVLEATTGSGTLTTYINESNATATGVENQYSIRLKAKRYLAEGVETTEYRYGFTVNHAAGGFTYICRNDWIKIPIEFGDWSFRIEALQFVPIAGYQTTVVSADALSAVFRTGGNICVRPMVRKNTDPEGVWRSIFDSEVEFNLPLNPDGSIMYHPVGNMKQKDNGETNPNKHKAYNFYDRYEALNEDGTGMVLTGDTWLMKYNQIQPQEYQEEEGTPFINLFEQLVTGDFVGSLVNEDYVEGTLTLTLYVKLEGRLYSFSYNIVLAKNS